MSKELFEKIIIELYYRGYWIKNSGGDWKYREIQMKVPYSKKLDLDWLKEMGLSIVKVVQQKPYEIDVYLQAEIMEE